MEGVSNGDEELSAGAIRHQKGHGYLAQHHLKHRPVNSLHIQPLTPDPHSPTPSPLASWKPQIHSKQYIDCMYMQVFMWCKKGGGGGRKRDHDEWSSMFSDSAHFGWHITIRGRKREAQRWVLFIQRKQRWSSPCWFLWRKTWPALPSSSVVLGGLCHPDLNKAAVSSTKWPTLT